MKLTLARLLVVLACAIPAFATNYYVTQAGAGSRNGSSLANAWAMSDFLGSSAPTGGDTVYFSGTITSQVVIPKGGTGTGASRLTLDFSGSCSGCTPAVVNANADYPIYANGKSHLVIKGGTFTSPQPALVNSLFRCDENTAASDWDITGWTYNGPSVSSGAKSVLDIGGCSAITIENSHFDNIGTGVYNGGGANSGPIIIRNNYIRTAPDTSTQTDVIIMGDSRNVTIEGNWLINAAPGSQANGRHNDVMQTYRGGGGSNQTPCGWTIRYNKIATDLGSAPYGDGSNSFSMFEGFTDSPCGFSIKWYSNVFYGGTGSTYSGTAGYGFGANSAGTITVYNYNNTYYRHNGPDGGFGCGSGCTGGRLYMRNNVEASDSGSGSSTDWNVGSLTPAAPYDDNWSYQMNGCSSAITGTSGTYNRCTTSPQFTSAGTHDYSLAAGSPLKNAGDSTIGAEFNQGICPGATWPNPALCARSAGNWDVGAYQTNGGGGPVAPTVTTTTATSITSNSASSGGNVTADGGASVTSRGVCYATTSNPTSPCTSNGTGTGNFTSSLTSLSASTLYHYRAFAANSVGTSYGSDLTFTTLAPPAPIASLSPGSHSYGSQKVGTSSSAFSFTLQNTGNAALTITSITFTGANSGDFSQSNTCGGSVAAAGSCTINVTFTPAASGARSGTLSIADNAAGSPHTASLTGTGTTPIAGLAPASQAFSAGVSKTNLQSFTLSNTGTASMTVSSITVSGDYTVATVPAGNCGGSIAAAGSCTVNVTFTPKAVGTRNGTLTVNDDASGTPHTASLNGTGTHYSQIGMGGTGFTTIGSIGVTAGTGENAYCGPGDTPNFGGTDGPANLPTDCTYTALSGTPSNGTVWTVAANGSDLQAKIDGAACGDVIVTPNTTISGHFTVSKQCDSAHWLTIKSAGSSDQYFPPEGSQATPCERNQISVYGYPDYASTCLHPAQRMTTISGPSDDSDYDTAGAAYIRFIGQDLTRATTGFRQGNALLKLDNSDHIVFDRGLVHGVPWTSPPPPSNGTDTHVGASIRGTHLAIINSWIYDIDWRDPDGQAIAGGTGTQPDEGPVKIYNNLLSGPSETWLLGGGGDFFAFPHDYEIRRNLSMKPLMYMWPAGATTYNIAPNIKNLGELKIGSRVLYEDNIFMNDWDQGDQYGRAVLFMPKNQARYSNTKHVNTNGTDVTCVETDGTACAAGTGIWGNEIDYISRTGHIISIHGLTNGDGVAWPYINANFHITIQNIPNGTLANLTGGGTFDLSQLNGDWVMGCNDPTLSVNCTGDNYGSHMIYLRAKENSGKTSLLNGADFGSTTMPAHTGMTQDYVSTSCPSSGHCAFSSPSANYPTNRIDQVISNTHIKVVVDEGVTTNQTHTSCRPGPEPDAKVSDLTIRYNYVTHVQGWGMAAGNVISQCADVTKGVQQVSIHDNVGDDIDANAWNRGAFNAGGTSMSVSNQAPDPTVQPRDIWYFHNTDAGHRAWPGGATGVGAFGFGDGYDYTYKALTVERKSDVTTITFNNISGDSAANQITVQGFADSSLNGTWDIVSQFDTYISFTNPGSDIPLTTVVAATCSPSGVANCILFPPRSQYTGIKFTDNIGPAPIYAPLRSNKDDLSQLSVNMDSSWTLKNNLLATALYAGYTQATNSNYPALNPDNSSTCTVSGGCSVATYASVFANWNTGLGDTTNNDYTVTANYRNAGSDGKDLGADMARWKALKQAIMPHFTFTPLSIITVPSPTPFLTCSNGVYCEAQVLWSGGASGNYQPSFVQMHITNGSLPAGMYLANNDSSNSCKVNGGSKSGAYGCVGWVWGTPTQTGNFDLTFDAEDAGHQHATATLRLKVN